jgi:Cellulose binding domain
MGRARRRERQRGIGSLWLRELTRHRWFTALGTGAGAAAFCGSMIVLLAGHGAHSLPGACGLVPCNATLPPSLTVSADPSVSPSAGNSPSPTASPTATPTPTHHPKHTPKPTHSAQPRYSVTVIYALVKTFHGGFEGEFTIANHGTAPVSGWELTASLPGDHIKSVTGASYTTHGSKLILTPLASQPSIAPGASQLVFFTAGGTSTSPTSCTFNGAAC